MYYKPLLFTLCVIIQISCLGTNAVYSLSPIAHIHSPFKQKFAIPRQSQALSLAKGEIEFVKEINPEHALDGIEQFSHLWLLFMFHENLEQGFSEKVRPPRLGGNKKMGVFATRSTFRPNGIGMSLVENLGFNQQRLKVGGIDLLDATPIIDIKPYLPYADSQPNALAGYAEQAPSSLLSVKYDNSTLKALAKCEAQFSDFSALLENILSQDPRPAYKKAKADTKTYHLSLYSSDVHWQVHNNTVTVLSIDI